VRTHEVVIEDGTVYVRVSTDAPNLPPCIAARLAGGIA
jgi:3-phenylpropionate/trans-cinnamate dioxygenase ferredoxin subunit